MFKKLAHPLSEVRLRALRSLQFKLQHGLLDAMTAAATDAPERLLDFLALSSPAAEPSDALAALEVLAVLAAQPATAACLLRHGADQVLIRLADEAPPCTRPATALLGALLAAAAEVPPCYDEDEGSRQEKRLTAPVAPLQQHNHQQQLQLWGSPGPLIACSGATQPWPTPPASAAASRPTSPSRRPPPPPDLEDVLAACGRRVAAACLSEEDAQQLFEVALDLAEQAEEAALLAALATLRHGVLADMPAAAVAGEPAVAQALLRLVAGSGSRPKAAAAALQVLHTLAASLAAADEAGEGEPGVPLAPFAYQGLLRCVALCGSDSTLQHEALATALALVPLLAPGPDCGTSGQPTAAVMAPLLAALADALRLGLVGACTAADVAPPDDWATGFHALTLCPDGSYGTLRLLVELLQCMPHLATTATLPPLLCDTLAALACHPVAAIATPDLHVFAERCLSALRPAVAAQLQATGELRAQRAGLLAAVQQLAGAPSAALAAACCREVAGLLPALALLAPTECAAAVNSALATSAQHSTVPPAGTLTARLLLHHQPTVSQAALQALTAVAQQQQQSGGSRLTGLLLHPAVAGSLIMALGAEPPHQQLAAGLLQAAASDPAGCGRAFLPWEPWLLCHVSSPAAGPAVASVLQLVAGVKRSAWQQLAPLALALFHGSPAVASGAAAQLHSLLVQHRPAAAGMMLFNPLPFDGLLAAAGSVEAAAAAARRSDVSSRAAAASAAKLFSVADVQSLLAVARSTSLQPELVAAALGQLAQVAGDSRFVPMLASEPVLAILLAHALDASPFRHVQLPALACLVALARQHPAAVDWLLADADARVVPLLPLALHPLPAVRQAAAELLHHLLFATAGRQLYDLAAHVGSNSNSTERATGSSAARWSPSAVPEPFCASHRFPCPAVVLPVGPTLHPIRCGSVFGSQQVQRLWRAQQLCEAAAGSDGGGGGNSSSGGSLMALLACPAGLPRWEADLVRSSLATLSSLRLDAAVAESLQQLAASQDHAQCRAALHRLLLLMAALPEGLAALAAGPWHDALGLLLSAAPLSPEDCQLWLDMLPLLQQLLEGYEPGEERLQRLASQFVGGSAFGWVEQLCGRAAGEHMQAALLPAVLHTAQLIAEHARRRSGNQREQLLESMRALGWLELLCQLLQQGGYAARVAALRLAAVLVGAQAGRPGLASATGPLLAAVLRRVLMPRQLWGTAHRHGKAAVQAALELLHAITQAVPADVWAAAWAGVGSTYWLSRAAGDSSPAVRQAALCLMAGALAVPATHSLLAQAWPECGDVAVKAVLDSAQPAGVRAAALAAVAACLSPGLTEQASPPAKQPEQAQLQQQDAEEGADEQQRQQGEAEEGHEKQCKAAEGDEQQQQQPQGEEGAGGEEGSPAGGQLVPVLPPLPSMAAERLLEREDLWSCVRSILQDCDTPNDLHSAAAAATLQHMLLDAERACQELGGATLLRLLRLPAAAAEAGSGLQDSEPLSPRSLLDAEQALSLQHAIRAAHTAAGMVAVATQVAPQGAWAELASYPDLLAAAAAAFSLVAWLSCDILPEVAQPVVRALQQCSRASLAQLADATALLCKAVTAGAPEAQLQAVCACTLLPLAVAIAAALSSAQQWHVNSRQQLSAACCRLLAVVLQQQETAAAFLLDSAGSEHQLPSSGDQEGGTVGAVLCSHLLELFVTSAAGEPSSSGSQQLVLHAALGGLLVSSPEAKRVALVVDLHRSLINSCSSLGASLGTPPAAPPAQQAPAPEAAAASRAGKLQTLKQRRCGGGAKRASTTLAFGSRLTSQQGSRSAPGAHSALQQQQQQRAEVDALPPCDGAAAAAPAAPARSSPAGEQRLLLCLQLLQQLAYDSQGSSDSLVDAGVLSAAVTLWGVSGTAVQHGLLSLLATLLGCSSHARQALSITGDPPLLERLIALVLSGRPLATASAAAAALSAVATSPDGARLLLHTSGLLPRVLWALQDQSAAKQWRCMLPILQVLADLCSQPEVQRAALACTSPSGSLPGMLLALTAPAQPPGGTQQHQQQQQQQGAQTVAAAAAMLAIRQLALCPAAKAWFCSQHGALQQLLDALAAAGQALERAAAAAHALWALAHGSGGERVKVALRRCCGWADALAAALAVCEHEETGAGAARLRQPCTALQRLLA